MIQLNSTALFLLIALGVSGASAQAIDPAPYDKDKDGTLSADETRTWLTHSKDPLLAKYDRNFNRIIDSAEARAIQKDI